MVFASDTRSATLTPDADLDAADARRGRARRRVFLVSSLLVLAGGCLYTLLQPLRYESVATVLMSAPAAIDERLVEADVQAVAIQRRTLTGSEITRTLADVLGSDHGITLSAAELRASLDVRPVAETNLLELAATGGDAQQLPVLVETWIDVYADIRARDIEARKAQTLTEVGEELTGLDQRLREARDALAAFREEHEIISMERQENAVLAKLDGLNGALNKALEEEVRSKAYLDSLEDSLADGQRLVPQADRGEVAAMASRLTALRSRLADLRLRYTDDYIRKAPRLREIPGQIAELEAALGRAYEEGSTAELAAARLNYRAARESVADLERRLADHKQAVAEFNTIYARHQALVADLARLEELSREMQARRVQIEVSQVEKYPQVAVVDWPAAEARRIGPPYLLLLGGSLLAALLAGIFSVWLHGYLHPRSTRPAFVTLSGVHMYPGEAAALERMAPEAQRLQRGSAARLENAGGDAAPGEGDADEEPRD